MFSVMFWLPLTLGFSKMQCRKECLSHWMTKFNLRTQLSVAWLSNSLSQLYTWSKVYIYAASNVPHPICPGTSVCKLLWWNCWILRERGLAGTALTGREGPWVSTHMKGRLRHLGALMTDWAALFWLKSSFNMHDKRRPSGTFLGNSARIPWQTSVVSATALHHVIVSGRWGSVKAQRHLPEQNHLLFKAHPVF